MSHYRWTCTRGRGVARAWWGSITNEEENNLDLKKTLQNIKNPYKYIRSQQIDRFGRKTRLGQKKSATA